MWRATGTLRSMAQQLRLRLSTAISYRDSCKHAGCEKEQEVEGFVVTVTVIQLQPLLLHFFTQISYSYRLEQDEVSGIAADSATANAICIPFCHCLIKAFSSVFNFR